MAMYLWTPLCAPITCFHDSYKKCILGYYASQALRSNQLMHPRCKLTDKNNIRVFHAFLVFNRTVLSIETGLGPQLVTFQEIIQVCKIGHAFFVRNRHIFSKQEMPDEDDEEEVSVNFENFLHSNGTLYSCFEHHGNRVYVDDAQVRSQETWVWYKWSHGHWCLIIMWLQYGLDWAEAAAFPQGMVWHGTLHQPQPGGVSLCFY